MALLRSFSQQIQKRTGTTDEQRGKEWEYRVMAVNKADEGTPSNTVMAAL